MSQTLNQKIINQFYNIYRSLRKNTSFDKQLLNLTILQIHTLIYIYNYKHSSVKELADYFKISLPTASVLLNKLVELNLVKRNPDNKDRRINQLTLTLKGKKAITIILKERQKKINSLLSKLTKKDRIELFRIIKKIN